MRARDVGGTHRCVWAYVQGQSHGSCLPSLCARTLVCGVCVCVMCVYAVCVCMRYVRVCGVCVCVCVCARVCAREGSGTGPSCERDLDSDSHPRMQTRRAGTLTPGCTRVRKLRAQECMCKHVTCIV